MGEAIVITSGKGGVGKSTLCAALGRGLARAGKRVLLLDADTGMRSLDVMLGMENKIVYDALDVAMRVCRLNKALVPVEGEENLFLLAAAQTPDVTGITPRDMAKMAAGLKKQFDMILIDCGAGIGPGFRSAVCAADRVILAATADAICVRDAEQVLSLVRSIAKIADAALIVNRVTPDMPQKADAIAQRLQVPLLGMVPEDRTVPAATSAGRSLIDMHKPAGKALSRIARRMAGETVAMPPLDRPGFWRRLFRPETTEHEE